MSLSPKDVQEIAVFARLALSSSETEKLARELGNILGYVEKLQQLKTDGVEPTTHAVPMDCPLREDVCAESLPTDEVLSQAPGRVENFFAVPKIIDV